MAGFFGLAPYALYITDDINARLGITLDDDFVLPFAWDSEIYRDYTITDEGIEGTALSQGESAVSPMYAYALNDVATVQDVVPVSDYRPFTCDSPRIAFFVREANASGTFRNRRGLTLLFEKDGSITTSYNITYGNNQTRDYIVCNMEPKVYEYNLYGSSAVNSYNRTVGFIIAPGDNYYTRLNNNNYCEVDWIASAVPIFDTEAHARAYLADYTNSTIDGILNYTEGDPYSDYDDSTKYWYIRNFVAHGSGSSWTPDINVNYRFKPKQQRTVVLYKKTPTASDPTDRVLKNYSALTCYESDGVAFNDDDDFYNSTVSVTKFLSRSVRFGDVNHSVNTYDTNMFIFESEQDADDYIAGLLDETAAINYEDVARKNQDILTPDVGELDEGNDNGTNGQVYSVGARMHVLDSTRLASFFGKVFDTANIDAILDGTKLFGANQINAINGITYFPCPISDFCDVGGGTTVFIGSWQVPDFNSLGYVVKNNKMIDCGSAFYNPVYNDFRDLEPYTLLYVSLPYCGVHQLQVAKYYKKTISVKYSIDVTTGAASAHIYADGIELDTFDGQMASQRPITAIDQTAYLSNVIGAINSAVTPSANMAGGAVQAVTGAASGNVAGAAAGLASFGGSAANGVISAYNIKQAVDDPPMTTRGGFVGSLGFFGNQKVHLIFAQKKTIRPENEQMLIGYPSGQSGTVGSFSGFLKCTMFKMADGFTGTRAELDEIMAQMQQGIYV